MKTETHIAALVVLILAACAGTPQTVAPPEWARNVETAYPRAAYIAQKGGGVSRQGAENAALAAIAFYFESEITAEESTRQSWVTQNGVTEAESRTEAATIVRSAVSLVAVRYAEDPWLNPVTKTWETVAYIDRAEAWTVYEPQAKKASDALLGLYASAEDETEAFSRALRFGAVETYAEGAEFNAARQFSQVLHPKNAQTLFADADAACAALSEKIYTARQNARVFIECPTDFNELVYQATVSAFGAEGFPVERNRSAASSVCVINVDEGKQKMESGVFYTPSLTGTVNGGADGKSGAVFSFTVKAERLGAINDGVAKRRAYTALAAALQESFPGELNKKRVSLK
jgi:hypothetical protein